MKSCIAVSALLMGTAWASSQAAEAVSPDIFQTNVTIRMTPGDEGGHSSPITIPVNKRLVIQAVSFYASGGIPGSTTKMFLQTEIFGFTSLWALPNVYIDTTPLPSTTLAATFYAGAGSSLYVLAYRSGDTTQTETVSASISGYYVDKP